MRLSDIVLEIYAHGRLPMAVAVRPELYAEAWAACDEPTTVVDLLFLIEHAKRFDAGHAVLDYGHVHGIGDGPSVFRSRDLAQSIKDLVGMPSFEDVLRAVDGAGPGREDPE